MAGTPSPAAPTIAVAEVRHGSVTKKIAVYEKMRPSELNLMLHAAFFAQGAPEWATDAVGFAHAKTKTFIPLAIGTAFPTLFQPNHTYELVLAKAAATTTTTPPPAMPSSRPWTERLYALLSQWSATSPSALSPDQLNRLELLIGPTAKPSPKAKPALHVATSLPDDVGSMTNLIFSPSHYPPTSTEFYIAQLLERLVASSDISAGQQMALKTLIKKQDARLFAAAASFQRDGDKSALVPVLHDLCGVLNWEANHQSILYTWIVPLEQSGRGAGLLMAAYFLFLQDRNEDDFTDTLVRLATSCATTDTAVAKHALDELVTAGRLSQDVEEHLVPEDPRVLAALDVYADSLDIPDLVDTLERIASPDSTVASSPFSPRTTDKDDDDEKRVVDVSVMEKQILHLVSELGLPEDELLALKSALVENDVVVQAAIQVFEAEKDEEDFKDTLRRVARHRVSASEAVPDAEMVIET
ncbi:hypothetical protein SPRG_22318 [Saprolegnia parasitica CBS 223.65]|uniref:Uncharacterized protein n=1 Tax=Saprolegnia parasitica (strain CBS 223.65) TaxID=695850 RepID=A0A067BY00_SAPPC|nr:hypothetical protein SPRG_22318 [Saprolegnia parasitica CBS 223.65]KDO21695.1 hypothetical protein SPRG_22318 [Saprolegnia parasitica CBS 223.65]|eukprot:XP_012207633.1 hypothetical protein SPRG_22318 [Saprolegnia parasitica CBS 223.65]